MEKVLDLNPFENIDRQIQVEVCLRGRTPGIITKLYPFARDRDPLSYETTSAFVNQPQGKVGIIAGVEQLPFLPLVEIDGLPGSLVLTVLWGSLEMK